METAALESVSALWIGKFLAAVVVGLGIGTLVSPEPVAVPVVGTVSRLLVGSGAVVVGSGLYLWIRRSTGGRGCGDSCGC
ncbi:hypothetical protein [Haloterrigena salifodinae]|uniref:hypothetical protein n=1 Tax=Haloterrigena salifodinae TaxID=2675099 RepID=UPI000F86F9DD|nr:hypothetical protein [Haloterrigena salifodinae]